MLTLDASNSLAADLPIHLHALPAFSLARTLNSHTAGVNDVSFSPDSSFLASASDDKSIRIWEIDGADINDGSVRVLIGHMSAVFCVGWNPRGDLVASGGMDETVRVWDIQKGMFESVKDRGLLFFPNPDFNVLTWLWVWVWRGTGTCMRVLPAHSDPVSAVQFNRDGTIIVSGSWDGYMSVKRSNSCAFQGSADPFVLPLISLQTPVGCSNRSMSQNPGRRRQHPCVSCKYFFPNFSPPTHT